MKFNTGSSLVAHQIIPAKDDTHTPLLYLHGALGTKEQFTPYLERFAEKSQFLMDFPSHGASTTDASSIDIKWLATETLKMLDHWQVEKIDIIGYSMVPAAAAASTKSSFDSFNPETLPTRRRRPLGPERVPANDFLSFPESAPAASVTEPLLAPPPVEESGPERIPAMTRQGMAKTFKRRGGSRFRM